MDRLYVLIFCLLASCYLDVGSSGERLAVDEPGEGREADAALVQREDAAAGDAGSGSEAGALTATTDESASDASTDGAALVPNPDAATGADPSTNTDFTLSSPAFTHGARMPDAFTCKGADKSPPFEWTNPPAGVRSFALVLTATRAALRRSNVEWVLWNIPADNRMLPGGMAAGRDPSNGPGVQQEALSELERAALDLGVTDSVGAPSLPAPLAPVALPSPIDLVRRPRYRGPCDEQGVSYEFTLFALDATHSEWDGLVSLEAVAAWMKTRNGSLGQASLVATYP